MTKLFYTDPLIAAYMAREFGVEYVGYFPKVSTLAEAIEFMGAVANDDGHGANYIEVEPEEKYYIHPDSYSIFDPKVGDSLQFPDHNQVKIFTDEPEYSVNRDYKTVDWQAYGLRHGYPEIIMRDNKHFFDCLREEDND